MDTIFNLEKLRELLKDFHQLTQLRTVLFSADREELLSWPEKRADLCTIIRESGPGSQACILCDRQACEAALRGEKEYIYRCHAGLTEAIMPLKAGKAPVGFLLFGHIFSYPDRESGLREVEQRCRAYQLDEAQLRTSVLGMPLVSEAYIKSAAHILHATASYLMMERMAYLKEDSAAYALDLWLSRHYTEKVTAEWACEALNMGRSKLFRTAREIYGCGLSEQVTRMRMGLAQRLLTENPAMPVAEVAGRCGYTDYNYFTAVFTKEMHLSPVKYRRQYTMPVPEDRLQGLEKGKKT